MEHDPSGLALLRRIAIVQLVSGAVNVFLMTAIVTAALLTVGGAAATLCGGPATCFWACGLWGLALLPIGVVELLAGAVALVRPEDAGPFVRLAAILETASVAFGGVGSTVAAVAVWSMLRDPEVAALLDGPT